jgi:hypothetical protein
MLEPEWRVAASELRCELERLARLGEYYVVISTMGAREPVRNCYVQVIFDEDGDAYAEAASNLYLRDHPLSPSEVATLLSLGWSPPGTLGVGDRPGRAGQPDERQQTPHPPNFHRNFARHEGQRIIAETLLATLNLVYGIGHPAQFTTSTEPSQRRRERDQM